MASSPLFSERIPQRLRLWRGEPRRWSRWQTYRDGVHRILEKRTFRRSEEPEEAWRCCQFWQRMLLNKWNARVFAARFGCRLPALYWFGRSGAPLPDPLPDHFVIRPIHGTKRNGIYVVTDGRDLLRDIPVPESEVRRLTRPQGDRWRPVPVMLEEFVRSGSRYHLPLEYKCHVFGGNVALVQLIERSGKETGVLRCYRSDWSTFDDQVDTALPLGEFRPAPPFLAAMVSTAARLGAALGTYMRVDFFAAEDGFVFNEFSCAPNLGQCYTPFGDRYLGDSWAENVPGGI